MTVAVEWRVGDWGRIGDAEFKIVREHTTSDNVNIMWDSKVVVVPVGILAAMGAVRIQPEAPPTIGVPQSVADNPPPPHTWVLVWVGGYWAGAWSGFKSTLVDNDWWMPQPSARGVQS